ncbi:hypothetical protein CCP4SC76_3680002 [Gammaproteobacteria bacterium]
MANDITLGVKITADGSQANQELKNLSNSLDHTGESATKATVGGEALSKTWQELGQSAVYVNNALSVISQFVDSAKGLATLADDYALLEARIKATTPTTMSFAAAMDDVVGIAARTHSGLGEVAQLYGRLEGAAKMLGLSQKDIADTTEVMAKALQLGGATTAEANSALLQFSQSMASGVLRGEEFRSVYEAAPQIIDLLAQGLGVGRDRMKEMADAGALSAAEVSRALIAMKGQVDSSYSTLPLTLGKAMTDASNAFQIWIGEGNKSLGVTKALATMVEGLANNMELLTPAIEAAFGTAAVATVLKFGAAIKQEVVSIGENRTAAAALAADKAKYAEADAATFLKRQEMAEATRTSALIEIQAQENLAKIRQQQAASAVEQSEQELAAAQQRATVAQEISASLRSNYESDKAAFLQSVETKKAAIVGLAQADQQIATGMAEYNIQIAQQEVSEKRAIALQELNDAKVNAQAKLDMAIAEATQEKDLALASLEARRAAAISGLEMDKETAQAEIAIKKAIADQNTDAVVAAIAKNREVSDLAYSEDVASAESAYAKKVAIAQGAYTKEVVAAEEATVKKIDAAKVELTAAEANAAKEIALADQVAVAKIAAAEKGAATAILDQEKNSLAALAIANKEVEITTTALNGAELKLNATKETLVVVTNEVTVATEKQAAVTNLLGVSQEGTATKAGLLSRTMGLLGGPGGIIMLAAIAFTAFAFEAKASGDSTDDLQRKIDALSAKMKTLGVDSISYLITKQQEKIEKDKDEITSIDKKIAALESQKHPMSVINDEYVELGITQGELKKIESQLSEDSGTGRGTHPKLWRNRYFLSGFRINNRAGPDLLDTIQF